MDDCQALFPGDIETAWIRDFERAEPLEPEEEIHVARAVERRRLEFRAGRHCARAALRRAGFSSVGFTIGVGERRVPLWPDGWVGSISHTDSLCGAAVGPAARYRGIGLDIEGRNRVETALWEQIARPEEIERLQELSDPEPLATLTFSAKEAFYKAQFPFTRVELDFHDLRVERRGDRVAIELLRAVPGLGERYEGRLRLDRDHCVTAFALE